jgi:hypothetical protein
MFIIDIRWIFKLLFNLAILIVIGRLFYAPYEPKLQRTNLVYIFPCIGVLSSYLYLAVWFGWKRAFKILLYIGIYILLTCYFVLKGSLPKWLEYTLTISILILFGYGVYRIVKYLISLVKNIKTRINVHRERNRNKTEDH